jgi:1,4-dihydroxy-2-naphthoate octaprenyltransferase
MTSTFRHWVTASRPKTLAAAVVPVMVGTSIAYYDGFFDFLPAFLALICAILIQIGTNFANDYYDFIKGADTDQRIGFVRATSAGLIPAKMMFRATILTMSVAFLIGLFLVWHAGWIVLLIGILSLIFGIAYTGGPYPLGYNGLGDVFVFIFFGIVAVMTTYYVQALHWSYATFWASLAVGALSTNILVVNNLRDVPTDKISGKKTLGVLFGETTLKVEYVLLFFLAAAIPPHFYYIENYSAFVLLPLLTLPLMMKLTSQVWFFSNRSTLNATLNSTAKLMTLFGMLFCVGILLN